MSLWGDFMVRLNAGYKAFREPELIANLETLLNSEFEDYDARRLRYAIYWAMYENTAFRDIHKWSQGYKARYGLYRYIRSIYSPTYRLGEFWKAHLWGGRLDIRDPKSAIPISTEIEQLYPAIEQLYRWSNWRINKDIVTLYGATMGDVVIGITDDLQREKVYLNVIHPGKIADVEVDAFGNVKSYALQEQRQDPLNSGQLATYREDVWREGDNVVYATRRNDVLFDWAGDGRGAEWSEPYGFIPLVMVQHNNVGLDWGWSEFHPKHQSFAELDGLASAANDYIRKAVNAPMLMAGVDPPMSTPTASRTQPTASTYGDKPAPGRDELPFLYGPVGAKPEPILAPLDIEASFKAILELLKALEEDYPELKQSRRADNDTGEKSGRAYREARREATDKVQTRRANYDDALIRANQMAVAIGGFRGYENFAGFGLDSYAAGLLEHEITPRPVFGRDPLDDLELQEKTFTIGEYPIVTRWREMGKTDEEIAAMLADKQREDDLGLADTVTGISQ